MLEVRIPIEGARALGQCVVQTSEQVGLMEGIGEAARELTERSGDRHRYRRVLNGTFTDPEEASSVDMSRLDWLTWNSWTALAGMSVVVVPAVSAETSPTSTSMR